MLLEETSGLIGIAIIAIVVIVILSMFFRFVPVGLWVTAYFSGVKVSIGTLVGMRLRRVAPQNIIRPLI